MKGLGPATRQIPQKKRKKRRRRPQNTGGPSENKIWASTGPGGDGGVGGGSGEVGAAPINNMLASINLPSIRPLSFTFHGNGSSDLLKCLSSA